MKEQPLVSICIPNYNYERYLPSCLDSVLAQTYKNFEVIFRDNASTDSSFEIAKKYQQRFTECGIPFYLGKNLYNYGSDRNSELCAGESKGAYRLMLASDDVLYPDYLERVMAVFTQHADVSMVMTHMDSIDGEGKITTVPPFYNCSCVIPGEDQAAVFMLSGIAIPGQRVMRVSAIGQVKDWICTFQVANDWYYNALMACVGDIAYINKPLMQYRVHHGNETNQSEQNLTAVMEHYQIIHKIAAVTQEYGYTKPADRLPEAIEKLGNMCLRYAYKMLKTSRNDIARKYLNLAKVFKENIEQDELFENLNRLLLLDTEETGKELQRIRMDETLKRNHSYDPPEGSLRLG